MTTGLVPDRPVITVEISADQSVRVAGETVPVPPGGDPRGTALAVVAEHARLLGHPVRVHAMEADGTIFPLNVYADRSIAEAGAPIPAAQPRGRFGRRRAAPEAAAPAPAPVPLRPPPPVALAQPSTAQTAPMAPRPTWAPPGAAAEPAASSTRDRVTESDRLPDGLPAPKREQRLVLDLIRGAVQAGDGARALAMAADLDAGAATTADPAERLAMREVHGYVALVMGRPELAVRLYAEAVTFGDALSEPGEWPARMAANAHFSWLRVPDSAVADAVGELVVGAYAAGGNADSPGARAADKRMARARARV
ncbi:hypothetical protein [Embleya scabrispora]|uniref:hypothetical protein n=1 Tax=Embleya scabrispora TaxID=159449 RepID=UPI00035FD484|nr:hypothetical protein [Embleya scabrispora]MYS87392.1 hypothetical protein [Streptomyces sp. SID5474]